MRHSGYESTTLVPLNRPMITLPTFFCPKLWESMTGDETERFCSKCQQTVHNIESLSVDQRLALLRSPKNSICGRYRIAVRRARPGYEQPYMQHLLKYGAGVAVSSAAFITLWQLYGDNHPERTSSLFRVGTTCDYPGDSMPEALYDEHTSTTLGMMVTADPPMTEITALEKRPVSLAHIDISLEPVALEKLIETSEPKKLEFPSTLLPVSPGKIRVPITKR